MATSSGPGLKSNRHDSRLGRGGLGWLPFMSQCSEITSLLVSMSGISLLWSGADWIGKSFILGLSVLRFTVSAGALLRPNKPPSELATALWLGQIAHAVTIALGFSNVPGDAMQLLKTGALYIVGLYFEIWNQGHARQVLQWWAVLLVAQFHACVVFILYHKEAPHVSAIRMFAYFEATHVILPLLFSHITGSPKPKPAQQPPTRVLLKQRLEPSCPDTSLMNESVCKACVVSPPQSPIKQTQHGSPIHDTSMNSLIKLAGANSSPGCLQAVSGASSLAAANLMINGPRRGYVSPLGTHVQASLKISSAAEPEDLPPGAALKLADMVGQAGHRSNLMLDVLHVAVRHGCILISTALLLTQQHHQLTCKDGAASNITPWDVDDDTTNDSADPPSCQHSHTRGSNAAAAGRNNDCSKMLGIDYVLKLAQQLLPTLLPSLGLASPASSPEAGHKSELTAMTLQLGSHRVKGAWVANDNTWHMEVLPSVQQSWFTLGNSDDTLSSGPASSLKKPCGHPRLGLARHISRCAMKTGTTVPSSRVDTSDEQLASCTSCERVVYVQLQVLGLTWQVVQEAGVQILGSDPTQNVNTHTTAGSKGAAPLAALQVWAHNTAGYTTTELLAVEAGNGCIILQLRLTLSEGYGLVLHDDVGGASCWLQPMTLELWSNDMLMSSTVAMLSNDHGFAGCSSQHSSNSNICGVQHKVAFGWWGGLSVTTLQAVLNELDEHTISVWDAACDTSISRHASDGITSNSTAAGAAAQPNSELTDWETNAHSLMNLYRDLSLCLFAIRENAYATNSCVLPSKSNKLHSNPALQQSQVQLLVEAVGKYAQQCELAHTAAVMKHMANNMSINSTWLATCLKPVSTAVVGFSCPACESTYRQHLWSSLSGVRACGSLILFVIGIVAVSNHLMEFLVPEMIGCGIWTLLHFSSIVMGGWCQRCCKLLAIATPAARILRCGASGLGLLRLARPTIRQFETGSWVIGMAMLEVIEQVALRSQMPAHTAAMLAGLGAVVNYSLSSVKSRGLHTAALSVITTIVAPLLVDYQLRRVLLWGLLTKPVMHGVVCPATKVQNKLA